MSRPGCFVVAVLAWISGCVVSAYAAEESPWDSGQHWGIRLIGGSAPADAGAPLRAGLEFRLDPGWKTYWRYPGDSGVPPVFDFSGSENLGSVTVLWPAPRRFSDGSGNSIGYERTAILPLRVTAENPARPVNLRLKLAYGVCEKLCVPAEGKAELTLGRGTTAHDGKLSVSEARVPKPVSPDAPISVRAVTREARAARPRILVDVAAPAGPLDLFVEGPTPDWALPLPEKVDGAPAGQQRFAFELDGLPPGAKPDGAMLRLTAVAGDQAIEAAIRLD
ncbi:MAG TPA: protein-disulfide reductase DsbD domain-containing protein [Xanthobacteraceae bacterium]|jgi:DsbC/DsbD-like thiol-disulfide interchange protein